MAEETNLDLKDIQGVVEEGLKVNKADWAKENQAEIEKKTAEILKTIESKGYTSKADVEKDVKAMQEQFDELAMKVKKDGLVGQKKLGFSSLIAKSLEENYEGFKDVNNIKGSKIIQMKETDYGNFVGFEDWRTEVRNDIVMIDRDQFHLRDIIGVGATTSDNIKYPVEGAKTGDGPAPWERGTTIANTTAKDEFSPNMTVGTADVEWIAGIMRLPVEMLADLPFLTSYLQQFARQELLEAEDNQILNGNGTSPQLDGLMPNATAYNGSYTVPVEMIVDAAYNQLAQSHLSPSDVILNPADVVSIILNKASGSGEYNLPPGSVGYVNGRLQIAGLDVRKTTKMAQGDFLVGAFDAAQIFQRLAPQLRFFEQDQDNVVKNLVTIRIEERIALAIYKAAAFIKGDFTPTT